MVLVRRFRVVLGPHLTAAWRLADPVSIC